MHNNNNNKRRQNNMGGGMGGQPRHGSNNRPRRFGGGGGGGRPNDDSANVVRVRRNATQAREKYQNMARDAMSMGDRVLAENYLQHAEHYYRVLLSLPPEEVRQPHHRNAGQQEGDMQGEGNDRQDMQGADDGAGHSEEAKVLPAFITQPSAQENIPE